MGGYKTLSKKLIVGFVIIGEIIVIACCLTGFIEYKNEIQRLYNDFAYKVAYVARGYIDGDDINRYLECGEADDNYYVVEDELTKLRDETDCNYIYVARQVGIDLTYVWDADNPYDEFEPFFIGDTGKCNPKFEADAIKITTTGERVDNYFYSKSQFGYNTSAIIPVYDSGNTIVGIVGVEIAMKNIHMLLFRYVLNAVLVSAILIIVVIYIYLRYLNRTVVTPIKIITAETNRFVKSENEISDKLDQIETRDEIELLAQAIKTMEIDINTYIDNITAITKEKERLGAELDVAKHIQASMLPSIFPPFPGRCEFDLYASMNPAKEVGGDFYDFFMIDDNHLGLVMADVSGKGVPAALFMVISKTLIKNRALMGESPATIFKNVNNQLCEGNEAQMFVTAWLGIYEITTGKMVCANAGHEYPAIKRNSGEYELLVEKHDFVLGGMEGMPYTEREIELGVGDRLFLYTDGVPESINPQEEQFGNDRMLAVLNDNMNCGLGEVLTIMSDEIVDFANGEAQFDDMTMLVMEIKSRG